MDDVDDDDELFLDGDGRANNKFVGYIVLCSKRFSTVTACRFSDFIRVGRGIIHGIIAGVLLESFLLFRYLTDN